MRQEEHGQSDRATSRLSSRKVSNDACGSFKKRVWWDFEPTTNGLKGRCSYRPSYKPMKRAVSSM